MIGVCSVTTTCGVGRGDGETRLESSDLADNHDDIVSAIA